MLFGLLICSQHTLATAESHTYRIWQANTERAATLDFIELALQKSIDQFGSYTLISVPAQGHHAAFNALVTENKMDMLVSAVNAKWETRALPIYIPLDRGLLGFRVCFIKRVHQPEFAALHDKFDLKKQQIIIGLGQDWPDTEIMLANHINVTPFGNAELILEALRTEVVDCFSRSIAEIQQEKTDDPDISIEQAIGFIYPLSDIIYIAPDAQALHKRLTFGLEAAIEDGSFHDLIDQHYQDALIEMNFYFRNLIIMDNPFISAPALKAINQYGIASFNQAVKRP